MAGMTPREFFLGKAEPEPDFENVVKVIISTFAVFVGFTITEYLRKPDVEDYGQWRFWAFIALASLLLRYIIGSSVHLNHVYVKQIDVADNKKRPRSRSVLLLFKDICFLVIFGMIAVHTTKAMKLDDFVRGTLWFVGAGFVWSCVDGLIRGLWSLKDSHEGPGKFVILWIVLDVALFLIVLAVNHYVGDELRRAEFIACIYVLFLFLDFLAIIRAAQAG
jgi:FtsH-binding integral membrane protein